MNQLTLTVLLSKHFSTKAVGDDEYRFSRNGRYFSILIRKTANRITDESIISELLFYERIMPESEAFLIERVKLRLTGTTDASNMGREDVIRWITKQMVRAILLNEDAALQPAAAHAQ